MPGILGLKFQALVFFGSALCSSIGPPFIYTASSPLGFSHQMEAILFIACKQAATGRTEKELVKSEVAGWEHRLLFVVLWMSCKLMQWWLTCSEHTMSSRWVGGGRRGIGRNFDRSLWPGGRAFELSCCPGGKDIWIFVRARDHKSFPGQRISVIFDLTFLSGGWKFDSNFLENVKIPPYSPSRNVRIQKLIAKHIFECFEK